MDITKITRPARKLLPLKTCGAVIVADGAGDVSVQLRLLSAVTTLLGVNQERVAIYEREGR